MKVAREVKAKGKTQNMIKEGISINEQEDMYNFMKEIMCNSEMENTIEIDKDSIQTIKTTKN